jgi:hypothetical protein
MTRIAFKINKNKGIFVEFDNTKSEDYKYYRIQKIFVYDKNWKNKQSEWSENIENDRFELKNAKEIQLWLKVFLELIIPKTNGYAYTRVYYLHLYDEKEKISINTYAKLPRVNSGYVKACTWSDNIWRKNNKYLIKKYDDLLRFYLLNCPSKTARPPSKQYIDIYELWGRNCFSVDKEQLKAKLSEYKVKGINDKTGGIAGTAEDMKHRIEAFDLLEVEQNILASINKGNRIVLSDTESNQYLSLFRHLRNAIAHGSFYIYNHNSADHLIFQDSNNKNVTARGIINMNILKNWKEIILSKS